MSGSNLAYISCGCFFLVGLLTGVWKYLCILKSNESQAPNYVDMAHRASLLYSFACLVLAKFNELSVFSIQINFWATLVPIVFFGFAVFTYVIHGFLNDTSNQFSKPHMLGKMELPPFLVATSMIFLILGEIGGFSILFAGFLKGLVS